MNDGANDTLLAVDGLNTFYGANHILRGVSLAVGRGEAISLLGRNGMGKTTLLRSIMGLVRPKSGAITFGGADIVGSRPSENSRRGIAFAPEGRGIFPNLSVEENLDLAVRKGGRFTRAAIYDMFPRLAERRAHWGNQLSGGEQQMLTLGRALLTDPSLLLIDEATEGLAPKVRTDIWRTLRRVSDEGIALIVVDKNVEDLLTLCARHVILVKGEVVFTGTSADLREKPETIAAHLGI